MTPTQQAYTKMFWVYRKVRRRVPGRDYLPDQRMNGGPFTKEAAWEEVWRLDECSRRELGIEGNVASVYEFYAVPLR